MKLKYKYLEKTEIPEQYVDLYKEVDGEWLLSEVEGIKTEDDVFRLQESLRKERADHKRVKQTLSKLGDRDIEEVLNDLDKLDEYKEIAEKAIANPEKIDELVNAKLQTVVKPLERKLSEYENQLNEKEQLINQFQTEKKINTIHEHIRRAAIENKARESAIDDIVLIGERFFDIDDSGNIYAKEDSGITPGIDPKTWLTDMQSKKPHWWGDTSGIGASGSKGGAIKNPFSKENWNLTEQGKLVRENPEQAKRLAASAGIDLSI